ncbi:MAG: hypothetical protein V1867_05650 [Candidatus Falkowbacteria bacterium]
MPQEIERKFLVETLPDGFDQRGHECIPDTSQRKTVCQLCGSDMIMCRMLMKSVPAKTSDGREWMRCPRCQGENKR